MDSPTVPNALRIMVVDDEPSGRFLLEHRLRRAFKDCSVVACTMASDALSMLRASCFDAIITDNELGWESGSEFITQVRHRGVMCPIIMVTSSDDPKVERAAYTAGATKVFMAGRGDFPEFLRHLLSRASAESGFEQTADGLTSAESAAGSALATRRD